jgi:Mrp family chromosome partitioning ATPase
LPSRPSPRRPTHPAPSFESCTLPIVGNPADYYLEAAARICDQGASNYSNVLLFVSADRGSDACFSMPELAQAFALQLAGDVLLVDGDLREGRLSKQVSHPGAGMVEAMLGQAQWPDLIHPTNIARIDFVTRGSGQVPTFERPQFGWSALRPLYRAVLIGPANQAEPETLWLAARCDAVYFVISRLHTRRSNATAAVNALRAGGANVAGCIVVND